ncbi:hypothetical protein Nepgr_014281 [Nepenthes gracilis]|uniref:Protein ECERIFERUM 26-like n=1 Tax=Nepenthes gracilis TaxID=150966 RepID=A0AAD3SIV1_NEPGR|nr:hypothetical protein Nepgr_014281 [Nepenthes gracilis]
MGEVAYISKSTAVSSKTVQLGKLYSLSVLDRLMENHHIRMVYYFRSSAGMVAGDLIRKLKESITEMLVCYPVVTGRLVRNDEGKWMVKSNDAGVRISEARAKGSVESWLQKVDREKELLLVYWESMLHKPYFWSTFYVQLTIFEEGGLAVGLSCSHLLSDPISASTFIRAWAEIALNGNILLPPFFHPLPPRRLPINRAQEKPNTHFINGYKSIIEGLNPVQAHNVKTLTLLFTDQIAQSCMGLAQPNTNMGPSPSPFQALAGLFWVCISRVRGERNGLMGLSICEDARKLIGLDKGFFGNCMVYNKVDGAGVEPNSISQAATAVGEAMVRMNYEGIMGLIEWLESSNGQSPPPSMDGDDLICINLEDSDLYSAPFDECLEPLHVSCYVEPVVGRGKVLVLPSPLGEGPMGRVVMVTLPEDEVVKLCEDDLIKRIFSPIILMRA